MGTESEDYDDFQYEYLSDTVDQQYSDYITIDDLNQINHSLSTTSPTRKEEKKTSNKRGRTTAVNDLEKMKLAKLVEKEVLIWDLKHKLHSNSGALSAAWNRISNEMNKSSTYIF